MSDTRNLFADLSDEMVLKIFSYLDLIDVLRAASVCKDFNRLTTDNYLFFSIFKRDNPNETYDPTLSYKTLFIFIEAIHRAYQIDSAPFEEQLFDLENELHNFEVERAQVMADQFNVRP